MQNGTPGIALSSEEQQIIAFLHTLTVSTLISSKALGNPWSSQ
ncbi:hypothetical protein [uncultured Pontibacter sp.]|nr:hypothetical protein [uncultured Pontibacter sp.]